MSNTESTEAEQQQESSSPVKKPGRQRKTETVLLQTAVLTPEVPAATVTSEPVFPVAMKEITVNGETKQVPVKHRIPSPVSQYPLEVFSPSNGYICFYPKIDGHPFAVIMVHNSDPFHPRVGWSICSKKDKFVRVLGKDIAFTRMKPFPLQDKLPKGMRNNTMNHALIHLLTDEEFIKRDLYGEACMAIEKEINRRQEVDTKSTPVATKKNGFLASVFYRMKSIIGADRQSTL